MKATLSFWSSLWLLMLFPVQAAQIYLSSITHTNTIKGSDLLLLDSYLAPGSYTTRVITLSDFLATGGGGGGSGVFVANSHIITPTDLANATLHIGSGVSNWWGNSTDDAIVIVHDSSAGDSTAANWAIAATDSASNSTNYAFFGMAMSTGPQPFATITVAALTNSQDLAAPSSHWNLYLQPDQNVARIQMVNQGTNTFDLGDTGALSIRDYLSLSGYTNQIGDNGSALTYNGVAVGGGDTIWTNAGGSFQPIGSSGEFLYTPDSDKAGVAGTVANSDLNWIAAFGPSKGTTNVSLFLGEVNNPGSGVYGGTQILLSNVDTNNPNLTYKVGSWGSAINTFIRMDTLSSGNVGDISISTIPKEGSPQAITLNSALPGNLFSMIDSNGVPTFHVDYDGSITSGGNTNRLSWAGVTNDTITASTTNAIIAIIDGRKVYLLIANETPP